MPDPRPDLSALAAAVRSIERGESAAAPAPRGDAAAARRRRREAMAAEAEQKGAEEASPAAAEAAEGESAGEPGPDSGAGAEGASPGAAPEGAEDAAGEAQAGDGGVAHTMDGGSPRGAEDGAGDAAAGGPGATPEDGAEAQGSGTPRGPRGSGDGTAPGAGGQQGGAGAGGEQAGHGGTSRGDGEPGAGRESGAEAQDSGVMGGPRGSRQGAGHPDGNAGTGLEGGGAQRAGTGARDAGPGQRRGQVDPRVVESVARVLREGGAPGELAGQVVRVLGEGAAAALRGDPWLLLGVGSVRVEQADAFARAVLGEACGPGDGRRARTLVGRVLEDAALRGHTALPSDDVRAALGRYGLPDPDAAVAAAVDEGQLLVFREGDEDAEDEGEEPQGPLLLALDRYAMAEDSLADGFFRLLRSFAEAAPAQEWALPPGASASTAELLGAAAGSGLVVHCGGEAARAEPTALVAAARAAGLRAYAAAYTENGRRRLAAVLGEPDAAVTVHGLLSAEQGPGHTADGTLDLDLLAVLDAPQLTVEEAATLVEAVPDGARLVLSGDPHALWSAGPGRVFADLLASRACPRVVSRTPDPGPVGELVSCVGEGELTVVDAPGKEVVVVPVRDPREALHRTVQLVADSVPRAFGASGADVQVITTGHGGPVGTRTLNAALKERLNPGPGRFAGFDPGDRVVHVPAPGRTLPGTVAGAEADGLRLDCEGGPVLVARDDVAATVRHGWAVTAHQAAGMRWAAAVVVVPGDAGPLLTRAWAYTAFGRGERHLSVVQGAEGRLAQAVAGPHSAERTTRLAAALGELTAEG